MTWLSEIESRLAASTPGPWVADESCDVHAGHIAEDTWIVGTHYGEQQYKNCVFIAHAPEDITRLIEALKKSETKLRVATEALENTSCDCKSQFGPEYASTCMRCEALARIKETNT
jgi:hypothetical protein